MFSGKSSLQSPPPAQCWSLLDLTCRDTCTSREFSLCPTGVQPPGPCRSTQDPTPCSCQGGVLLHPALPPPPCPTETPAEPLLSTQTLGNPPLGSCIPPRAVYPRMNIPVCECMWMDSVHPRLETRSPPPLQAQVQQAEIRNGVVSIYNWYLFLCHSLGERDRPLQRQA